MYIIKFYENDILLYEDIGEKDYIDLDFIYVAFKSKDIISSYLGDYVLSTSNNDKALEILSNLIDNIVDSNIENILEFNNSNIYINGKEKTISCETNIHHQKKDFKLCVSCFEKKD